MKMFKSFTIDENAFFEGYAELYFPGILVKNLSGDRVRFGYQSPEGEKTPEKCDVIFKFIPNLIYPRKKAGFHFAMIPDATTTGKEKLNLLLGLAEMNGDTVVSEVYSKTLYNPAVETEISLSRSKSLGKRIFEFERQRSGDSQVDMYIAITEGANSTYAYVKEVPELVTLSFKSGRNGFIEFDAHGEPVSEIGVCDDLDNPVNKVYFSGLFELARLKWYVKPFQAGKVNVSVFTEGKGVSVNAHVELPEVAIADFSVSPNGNIIDCSMELNTREDGGYFYLNRNEFDIEVSFSVEVKNETYQNYLSTLNGFFIVKRWTEGRLEVLFDDLFDGDAVVHLAGKTLEITDLNITGNSPLLGGKFIVKMDHFVKQYKGDIVAKLRVTQDGNNITGNCSFDIVGGVNITNLLLKFGDYTFYNGNIYTVHSERHWYNFTIAVDFVEWHVYDDWGYVLIKGNSSVYFSFDSSYWDFNNVLIGKISGAIRLKTLSDVFNISWNTVDGNKTYSFDGSGVSELSDFHFMLKDKVDVNIPKLTGEFEINTFDKTGWLKLVLEPSTFAINLDIGKINITDLFEITLRGSIYIDIEGEAEGFLLFEWNESGGWLAEADFDLSATGTIDITDFEFNYQKNFADVSFDRRTTYTSYADSNIADDLPVDTIDDFPIDDPININLMQELVSYEVTLIILDEYNNVISVDTTTISIEVPITSFVNRNKDIVDDPVITDPEYPKIPKDDELPINEIYSFSEKIVLTPF